MDIHQDTEQTPLLRAGRHVHGTTQDAVRNSPPSRLAIAFPCLLLLALVDIGNTLISRPIEQIQWEAFCNNSNMSSIPSVAESPSCGETDFSLLQSWKAAFETVMTVLTAAPFGMAADAYGRKRIIQLSVVGIASTQAFDIVIGCFPETFPVHLIALKGFWTMMGGGRTVFSAMIFTILSDPLANILGWSTTFFYVTAAAISSQLLSYQLLLILMYAGNWICVYAGLGCLILSLLTTLLLPETRASVPESPPRRPIRSCRKYQRLMDFFKSTVVLARRCFCEKKTLGLLLLFCAFTTTGSQIPLMLLAWQSSERPDALGLAVQIFLSIIWSNILKIVLLTIILPVASYLLAKKLGLNPLRKDVYISVVSLVALVAGSLGIVVAKATGSTLVVASIYIYALGCGYGPAMHSLLGLLSGGCHIGMLYAIIGAMQSVGIFMGGILFGASFETAPFLFTVFFLVVGAGALFLIQWEDTQQRQPIWIKLDDLAVHNASP